MLTQIEDRSQKKETQSTKEWPKKENAVDEELNRNYRTEFIRSKSEPYFVLNEHNFQLPRLELEKFNGDVKNWLGFWVQFNKIYVDEEIAKEDKSQYLL